MRWIMILALLLGCEAHAASCFSISKARDVVMVSEGRVLITRGGTATTRKAGWLDPNKNRMYGAIFFDPARIGIKLEDWTVREKSGRCTMSGVEGRWNYIFFNFSMDDVPGLPQMKAEN